MQLSLERCKEEHQRALRDLAAAQDEVQQRDSQMSSLKSLGEIKDARVKALEDELHQSKLLLERCVCQGEGANVVQCPPV